MKKNVVIIGSGFSGMAAACTLAGEGFHVKVFEKNSMPGGRAQQFKSSGFLFDMGPTWYWLPDVFERFFGNFGKKVPDFYELKRLDPGYRIYFSSEDYFDLPAGSGRIVETFERIERGSGEKLKAFLGEAEYKYNTAISKFVHKPAHSVAEFFEWELVRSLFRMQIFSSVARVVRKTVSDRRLVQLLEFPVVFLGATANRIPALYTMMNWADMGLGTWYPAGGMYSVARAMYELGLSLGAEFYFNSPVKKILAGNRQVKSVLVDSEETGTDFLIASADYHHVESGLLDEGYRNYPERYWHKRVMAPSAVIVYAGVNRKLDNLLHHNLLFDTDFGRHTDEIYRKPAWPSRPAIYVSCSSKSDTSVAPAGMDNLVVLIPVAPGLVDNSEIKEKYFNLAMERIENICGHPVKEHIVTKRVYAYSDFVRDYHSFRGNAYGLANVLSQTAFLKPKIRSRKIGRFYYAGQLTTPGPGVPPTIISGQVAANEIIREVRHGKPV